MPSFTIKGVYRDRLRGAQGSLISDSGWRPNMIVLRCRTLLSGFLKNDAALGIQALQVGRGDPSWDTTPPAPPDPNTLNTLTDTAFFEIPVGQLTLQYLDASDNVIATPSNRLQITATLGPNVPPGPPSPFPLREFGLFGQLGGVRSMIDYIRHPVIQKAATATLERKVRLIF